MDYLGFSDMFDGGGPGQSGDRFEGGGLLSLLANLIATPRGSRDRQSEPQGGLLSPQAISSRQSPPQYAQPQYAPAPVGGPLRTPAMPSGQDIMASLLRDPQHMQRVAEAQRAQRAGNTYDQFGQFNLGLPAQQPGMPIPDEMRRIQAYLGGY